MNARFVNIILLIILFLPLEVSHASVTSGENKNEPYGHDGLSCLDCHFLIKKDPDHPSVEDSSASCNECHLSFSEFPLSGKYAVDCLDCHSRHNEKILHDAHSGVTCRVCHLSDIKIERVIKDGTPVWKYKPESPGKYDPHLMITGKEYICSRCHLKGNNLNAPDNLLPAKGILCMPCHAATFSLGGTLSVTAIIIFLIGIVSAMFVWSSAGKSHRKNRENKSVNFISIMKALFLDGFFQRRLFKVSVKRWFLHGMIFFPLVIRFLLGLVALVSSLLDPDWNITWLMLDKNNPVTGFIFDITGLMILTGGFLMFIEKRKNKRVQNFKGLPDSKIPVSALLGGIIISGFIVEGARIAMTGNPEGSQFAFIGYGISLLMSGFHLNGLYAYLWYLHALLTAIFIAILPFSGMFHVFIAPLSLLLRGTDGD